MVQQQVQMRNMITMVSLLVIVIASYEGWNRLSTAADPYSAIALEAITAALAIANIGYIKNRSIRAFQIALILSILQVVCYAQCAWSKGDAERTAFVLLEADQWPMGSLLFGFCWLGDRLMQKVIADANKALTELAALKGQLSDMKIGNIKIGKIEKRDAPPENKKVK